MKLVKTKESSKMGEYKPTAIDKRKQEADFIPVKPIFSQIRE